MLEAGTDPATDVELGVMDEEVRLASADGPATGADITDMAPSGSDD